MCPLDGSSYGVTSPCGHPGSSCSGGLPQEDGKGCGNASGGLHGGFEWAAGSWRELQAESMAGDWQGSAPDQRGQAKKGAGRKKKGKAKESQALQDLKTRLRQGREEYYSYGVDDSPEARVRSMTAEELQLAREQARHAIESGRCEGLTPILKKGVHPLIVGLLGQIEVQKHRLRPVFTPGSMVGFTARSRKQSLRATPGPQAGSVNSSWTVHVPDQLIEEGKDTGKQPAGESSEMKQTIAERLRSSYKEIKLRLESVVPSGCLMTINLNGSSNTLKPESQTRRSGQVRRTTSKYQHRFFCESSRRW